MNDKLKTLVQLLRDFDTAMLVTEVPSGGLISRPMALQDPRPDRALWFVTSSDTVSAQNIAATGKVNLSFHRASDHAWVSVSGRAVINADRSLVESLWKPDWSVWFPEGKQTPNIVLLDIEPEQIDFWESERGKLGTLFEMAKAALTDQQPELAPTRTLKMSDLELSGALRQP
jgi:general stress protein 26